LMPEREDLRLELETRTSEGPEGGEQGDEQRWHAPGRYQSLPRNGNDLNTYRISGRDRGGFCLTFAR
jgi:hypothetical protein